MAHVCDLRPYPDHDTRHVLDEAIEVLAIIRDLEATNPANRIHLLARLIRQADTDLTSAVGDAHHDGYSPIEISILFGLGSPHTPQCPCAPAMAAPQPHHPRSRPHPT